MLNFQNLTRSILVLKANVFAVATARTRGTAPALKPTCKTLNQVLKASET